MKPKKIDAKTAKKIIASLRPTIIQISCCADPKEGVWIFGLGADQKIYKWSWVSGNWERNQKD